MLRFSRHRRFQERLSAYMDGELAPRDARTLETHLESCESCSDDLAALRVASAALRELPDVDVPRSFALKPADVARPATRPATGMAHSLNSGLRLTGAGLAAVLALVLVLDVGGVVGGGDAGDSGSLSAGDQMLGFAASQEESKAAAGADALAADAAGGPALEPRASTIDNLQATPAPDGEGGILATPSPLAGYAASAGTPGSAGVGGLPPVTAETPAATEPAAAETSAATAQPLPATGGEVTPSSEADRIAPAEVTTTPTASPQPGADEAYRLDGYTEGDNGTLSVSESNLDPDDGPSALLVIEVALAALVGVSVAGVIAATYAERRRR